MFIKPQHPSPSLLHNVVISYTYRMITDNTQTLYDVSVLKLATQILIVPVSGTLT